MKFNSERFHWNPFEITWVFKLVTSTYNYALTLHFNDGIKTFESIFKLDEKCHGLRIIHAVRCGDLEKSIETAGINMNSTGLQ